MAKDLFAQITALGQSVWYDNVARGLLRSGELASMIERGEVRGVTSNPSIFEQAITGSDDYDQAIRAALAGDRALDAEALFERLAIDDIRAGADLLRPVFDQSQGGDGYISLEVSPRLADDTAATVAAARRLHAAVDRPNLMIKVPATAAGLPAIQALTAAGINVNATLIFSHRDWRDVAEAYVSGLEALDAGGGELGRVASVASFFVSRLDSAVDAALPEGSSLRGKTAVAYSKVAYAAFALFFSGERFAPLRARGARVQRLLWASTGTKNPAYSDLLYVEPLLGPDTVNTMPPATLDALRDHGAARAQVAEDLPGAKAILDQVRAAGVDLDAVTRELKAAGVASFARSFENLLQALEHKRGKIS